MTDSGAPRFMPAGYDSDNTTEDELVMPGGLNDSGSSGLGGGGGCLEDERIKIVPHLGWRAGLLEQDFEIELVPETIATWFEGFKDSFKTYKKGPIISQRLQMFYMNTQNPFEWALKLFANCPDHSSPKSSSLAYTVIEELNSFKKRYTPATDQLVDDNLRMVAFNFMTKQTHCLLFRLAVDTYELLHCREMFVPKVRTMLARKQYKEAGQIAVDLELFDHFDEHDFVMPLFLQDKISIAEDFLNRAGRLQRPVVQLLDSFFSKKESVESLCSRYITEHNVTDVYYSKLHQKPLSKLVQRLAKSYNIPKEFTPNVNKMKNFGALQFLCHKRYYEKGLNKDSWDEMVRDTVPEADRDLQLELVCLCSGFGDQAEAAKWAEHFRLKRKELPLLVQDYFSENEGTAPRSRPSQLDEKWDEPVATETKLTLPLDESRVHLVDSRDKFFAMTSDLSQQSLVAFDSEWKPTFGGANEVAVIQLATRDDVYLVDVLVSQLQGSDWSELAKSVFNRDDVLKLAFAPSTDFNMFQKALPAFNVSYGPQSGSTILDLQVLWRKVDAIKSFQFPFQEEITNQNLSNLAKLCLGKKLDKSNQFSNWAQRPLRREQIQYAALDAYVLLQIYDVIAKQLKAARIDLNEVLNGLLCPEGKSGEGGSKKRSSGGSGSSRRGNRGDKYNKRPEGGSSSRDSQQQNRNRMRSSFERPPGPNLNSVLVSDVRFVCDKMLEGLAKMLRRFGIDAVTIPAGEQADRCVFIAHNEKRYVLTRGNNYQKFADNLPSGHCYKVSNDQVDDQLLEVLAYFKIVIRQENIFSRCQLCNCGRFLQATPDQVYYLKHRTQIPAALRDEHRKPERDGRLQLDRSWVLERLEERHLSGGKTESGVRIDVAYVNDSVLANVDVLYVCSGCGKCYWDGSHLDNILAGKLEDLLTLKYD